MSPLLSRVADVCLRLVLLLLTHSRQTGFCVHYSTDQSPLEVNALFPGEILPLWAAECADISQHW